MRRAAGLLLVAALLGIAPPCSESRQGPPVQVLTSESVSRYRQGSPERAAIEWWRDIQYGNASGLVDRYAPQANVTGSELLDQVPEAESFFQATPRVDSVVKRGVSATVYLLAVPQRGRRQVEAVAVRLQQDGRGDWLISDNLLLERLADQAAARQTSDQGAAPPERARVARGERGNRSDRRGSGGDDRENERAEGAPGARGP